MSADKVFPPPEIVNQNLAATTSSACETCPTHFMRLLGKGYIDESALPALEQLISDLESGTHMVAGQA